MTTAERLIRNLCEAARAVVKAEQDAANARIEAEVQFKDLPQPVRRALLDWQRAAKAMQTAEAVIEHAGYETPRNTSIGVQQIGLQRPYKERRAEERRIMPTFTPRYQKIADLQNRAAVDVMDRRGAAAQMIVEKLRRDLEKV